jgi:crossover junction endodeoxyribonuclease RusA
MTAFKIPVLPPSANRLWRRSGTRIHKATAYTRWLADTGLYVKAQRPMPVVGPYKLSISAVRPDKRRRDVDNLIKPINDLLVHLGLVRDDSDCDLVSARWVTTGDGVSIRIDRAGRE